MDQSLFNLEKAIDQQEAPSRMPQLRDHRASLTITDQMSPLNQGEKLIQKNLRIEDDSDNAVSSQEEQDNKEKVPLPWIVSKNSGVANFGNEDFAISQQDE